LLGATAFKVETTSERMGRRHITIYLAVPYWIDTVYGSSRGGPYGGHSHTRMLGKGPRDVPKLGWEIIVNEQYIHAIEST
jgi:hypothetical protein